MHPNNVTYKMIAKYIGQSEQNMRQLKSRQPKKLELYKYGICYMLEHGLVKIEDLKKD